MRLTAKPAPRYRLETVGAMHDVDAGDRGECVHDEQPHGIRGADGGDERDARQEDADRGDQHAYDDSDHDGDLRLEQRGDEDRRGRDWQGVGEEVAGVVGEDDRQVELRDEQRRRCDQRERDEMAFRDDACRLHEVDEPGDCGGGEEREQHDGANVHPVDARREQSGLAELLDRDIIDARSGFEDDLVLLDLGVHGGLRSLGRPGARLRFCVIGDDRRDDVRTEELRAEQRFIGGEAGGDEGGGAIARGADATFVERCPSSWSRTRRPSSTTAAQRSSVSASTVATLRSSASAPPSGDMASCCNWSALRTGRAAGGGYCRSGR